jgi:hypothetical protein
MGFGGNPEKDALFTLTVSSPPWAPTKGEMESAKKHFQELMKDTLVPGSFKEISLNGYPGFQYEQRFRRTSRSIPSLYG